MQTTSSSLLMHLREPGQGEAWASFVRLYSPLLYTWARRMGLQDADAADLVQEVFSTLLQKLPEFDYDSHKRFRGWLWTVTKNKWLDRCRLATLPVDAQKKPDEIAVSEDDLLEEADFRQHLLEHLIPAMQDQFHPATWRAFWEHVIEGRSARAVAEELGVGVGAIYMAKLRVMTRLGNELKDLING